MDKKEITNKKENELSQYNFSDKLMFAIVMRDESLCKQFIERVFPERKVKKISLITTEHSIITGIKSKSVRLDVMFEGDNKIYDIEMQVADEKNLAKRSRYYHAAIAQHILKSGEDYEKLRETYVIFICRFDPLKRGEPVYRFGTIEEKSYLKWNDGCNTILLNTKCPLDKVPHELRPFFEYVENGNAEQDTFVLELHEKVEETKLKEEVRDIMTIEQEMRNLQSRADRAYDEGAQTGAAQKAIEIAKNLKLAGMSFDAISKSTGLSLSEIEEL